MEPNLYRRLAFYLCQQNQLPAEKEYELAYALEVLFINILNLTLTLLIGWLLGVLPGTAACLLVATAYRHTAGGTHARSPWICAAITMCVFPVLAWLGAQLAGLPVVYTRVAAVAAFLLGIYAICRYAPVDSVQAPIISEARHRRLKKYSYLVIGILAAVMLLLEVGSSMWLYARTLQMCGALTILWVSFNLTDTAAKLSQLLDRQQ